jgi:uncharacterized phage protein (TIGR02218 family)
MKEPSSDYIDKEEATLRKPVELYHIWRNDESEEWFYTDGDVAVVFDGDTYLPATLSRSTSKYESELEVTTLTIEAQYAETPLLEFLSCNPIDTLWIQVSKLFRDQDPLEAGVIFIGQIKSAAFTGVQISVTCVGFEHFLKMPIPTFRYQLSCNHTVFDSNCGLSKSSYKTTTVVTVSSNGRTLTSTDFSSEADGYFTLGKIEFGGTYRTIVNHVGSVITLAYKFNSLVTGNSVDAYPGCRGSIETCRDKFDNVIHFLGFPYIPVENPATRIP